MSKYKIGIFIGFVGVGLTNLYLDKIINYEFDKKHIKNDFDIVL